MASSMIVRPVEPMARFSTSRHSLGLLRAVINTCKYLVPRSALTGRSAGSLIEIALARVILQHDILRVGIEGEDTKVPEFVSLEIVDLRRMIEWKRYADEDDDKYTKHLLHSLELQHDKFWEDLPSKPGWMIIVHQNRQAEPKATIELDISFVFHHAYGDGQSALIFHRDLLRALNNNQPAPNNLNGHLLELKFPADLSPAEIVLFKVSWLYVLKTIWSELIWKSLVPSWVKRQPAPETIPWTGSLANPEPHQVNLRLIQIPGSTALSLLTACRANGTTLTPLIHVLILASMSARIPPDLAPAFHSSTPISLRRWVSPGSDAENAIRVIVTAYQYVFDAATVRHFRDAKSSHFGDEAESLLWATAAEMGKALRAKVASLPNDDIASLASWISDWRKFWTDQFGKKKNDSWECSNVGSVKAAIAQGQKGMDGWQIKRSIFTQGALPVGAAFTVNVAGVDGEGIWINISWQEDAVETALMEAVTGDVQSWFDRFSKDGRFGVYT